MFLAKNLATPGFLVCKTNNIEVILRFIRGKVDTDCVVLFRCMFSFIINILHYVT